jgi:hypothetical protein
MIAEVHWGQQHPLSGFESGNIFANFDNLSCYVAAENMRERDFWDSFSDPEIQVVHRACPDANEHLIFPQLRIGNLLVAQYLGPTSFVNANGFHGSSLRRST